MKTPFSTEEQCHASVGSCANVPRKGCYNLNKTMLLCDSNDGTCSSESLCKEKKKIWYGETYDNTTCVGAAGICRDTMHDNLKNSSECMNKVEVTLNSPMYFDLNAGAKFEQTFAGKNVTCYLRENLRQSTVSKINLRCPNVTSIINITKTEVTSDTGATIHIQKSSRELSYGETINVTGHNGTSTSLNQVYTVAFSNAQATGFGNIFRK